MLKVFCVLVGDLYGPEYVTRLAAMFGRHLIFPFRFHCVTDKPEIIPDQINGVQISTSRPVKDCWGWWNLQEAYRDPRWAHGGPILYVGLDTVITSDITSAIERRFEADRLTLLRDFSELITNANPLFIGTYADGVTYVPTGGVPFLWKEFEKQIPPDSRYPMHVFNTKILKEHNYVPDFWQEVEPGLVTSFKYPTEKTELPVEPIVCFHGEPRPIQVVDRVSWVKEHWRV